jgi:hypothetical protein
MGFAHGGLGNAFTAGVAARVMHFYAINLSVFGEASTKFFIL